LKSKVYLTLATLGKADVKTIAKASNIARQEIYRIMPTLQKLGLTEKIITNPTMYWNAYFFLSNVTLSVSAKKLLPSLWSNTPAVVELTVSYFNEM
jgi:DNA-binding IclR family transcriptional regulator